MQRRRALETLVVVACAVYLVWNSLYFWPFVVDDAFISFRYARQLVEGNGLVYNAGQRVEGYSNFLWVLLAAACLALQAPVVACAKGVGLAAGLATILVTHRAAKALLGERASFPCLLALVWLSTNTGLALWTQAGLETALFGALLIGAVARFERELARSGCLPLSALLYGLAWTTRPEAPIYLLYFAARRWSARRGLDRGDLVRCLVALGLIVPYEAWGLVYYGHLLPTTHTAKVGSSGFGLELVRGFFSAQGSAFVVLWGLGLLGCLRAGRRLPPACWLPALCGLAFALYAGQDWMPRYRLIVPALPFLALALAAGAAELRALPAGRNARRALDGVLLLACAGSAAHQAFGSYPSPLPSLRLATAERGFWPAAVPGHLGRTDVPLQDDAWRLLRLAPREATVAIADIGFPGFLAMNPVWDVRGLVTPAAARARNDESPEATAALVADLLQAAPAYVVLPLRNGRAMPWIARFDGILRDDGGVRARYERFEPEGADKIVYRRRGLQPFDVDRRIAEALAGFPSYDTPRARRERRRLGLGAE